MIEMPTPVSMSPLESESSFVQQYFVFGQNTLLPCKYGLACEQLRSSTNLGPHQEGGLSPIKCKATPYIKIGRRPTRRSAKLAVWFKARISGRWGTPEPVVREKEREA